MASGASLIAIGNWDKEVGVGLGTALAVSMDIMGKSGEKACRQALGFMAASAAKITKAAKKNRAVKGSGGDRYVEVWQQGRSYATALRMWQFKDSNNKIVKGDWEDAKRIGHRGLAQRSWAWGLSKFGVRSKGAPIRGASRVYTITGDKVNGYVKEDKLGYIQKAMPHGWERIVEQQAGNRIMGLARNKLEAKWRREMGLPKLARGAAHASNRAISDYFLKGAS